MGLARLQAAEFLYETRLFPELEYTFKHALTHEVAYGSLLQERRRVLHAQIVERDRDAPRRPPRRARRAAGSPRLAGGGVGQGRALLPEAGAEGVGRSANREAAAYFEQALDALGALPESQRTPETAVDLRLDLYVALLPLDQLRPLLERLREAETARDGAR